MQAKENRKDIHSKGQMEGKETKKNRSTNTGGRRRSSGEAQKKKEKDGRHERMKKKRERKKTTAHDRGKRKKKEFFSRFREDASLMQKTKGKLHRQKPSKKEEGGGDAVKVRNSPTPCEIGDREGKTKSAPDEKKKGCGVRSVRGKEKNQEEEPAQKKETINPE